jgi:hypothetical protein
LYPDDTLRLRAILVEALRRRGIHPVEVSSLADEALVWERPKFPISLTQGPAAVDVSPLIIEATRLLDLTDRDVLQPVGAGTGADGDRYAGGVMGAALQQWGSFNALSIGLDPDLPVEVVGGHVAYMQAADGQPRPFVAVQYLQRHVELEEPATEPEGPVRMYSGTTIIAKVNGQVEYLIAKPLPMSGEFTALGAKAAAAGTTEQLAQYWHGEGRLRWERLQAWFEQAESADAMAPWTSQPAVQRMTFARLHADQAEGD